ncbi:MAG TPA: hypothetical protein VGO52_26855 [Hyphomonadaceae bacterium]|jgi:hypothetical protein|nr:hypothetical protein [Hyphomonadaceae bacterium]
MRLVSLAAIAALAFTAALPASALTVETKFSAEFQKKLEKDYGAREAAVLTDTLVRKVEQAFAKQGVKADRVVVTIEDAKPNRPTMQQVMDKPGLDAIRSISLGGAELTGIAYDASGAEIGKFNYDWYENDLSNVVGSGTWSDARWTFDRFATRFADKLS